jgi:hypothetical protein
MLAGSERGAKEPYHRLDDLLRTRHEWQSNRAAK